MMKSAADVEREVETSRDNLDRTMEALKDKMTPGQLFDEASRALGSSGQQVFSKFVEQAKENPMPLAVMGLGLAWLMTSSGKPAAGYEPRSFAPQGARSGLTGASSGLADQASSLMDGVKDRLADAKDSLADAGASAGARSRAAAETLTSAAHSAADKAAQYRDQAQQTFGRVLESEPLILGALGLAVGAAIGAALPHTELEDRNIGPLRDKVLEKGKEIAETTLQQVGEVAQAAYGGAKDELAGASDGDLATRAETAARAAVSAAQDALHGDGQGGGASPTPGDGRESEDPRTYSA